LRLEILRVHLAPVKAVDNQHDLRRTSPRGHSPFRSQLKA
jgi:hypothetical protein